MAGLPQELGEMIDPLELQRAPGGAVRKAIGQAKKELKKEGRTTLPALKGVAPQVLARWFYRRWISQWKGASAPFGPLVIVDRRHLQEGEASKWWTAARGGILFLYDSRSDVEAETGLPAGLEEAVGAGRVRLLEVAKSPALEVSEEWRSLLNWFDEFHDVAVDPELAGLRRSLLANCLGKNPVHLRGEACTGKRSLVRWAHALLDDQPLVTIRGEEGLPQAGRWTLFEEVDSLGEGQQEALKGLLEEMNVTPSGGIDGRAGRRPTHRAFRAILGSSQSLVEVLEEVKLLARSELSLLLLGEPGVGKESMARAIHELSGRSGEFVALDMGALTESLAESELFGHVRGAFTGADRERLGAFRAADGGTLFLDEIGNLSPALQVRLLRVLQEKLVLPVGADQPVKVNTRVVAATNADLRLMVLQGRFRQDFLCV